MYVFAVLIKITDETADPDDDTVARELENRGSIVVRCTRGKARPSETERVVDPAEMALLQLLDPLARQSWRRERCLMS